MSKVHVNDRIWPGCRVYRHMSLHELIDLLTFGQLVFAWAHPLWRDGLARALGPRGRKSKLGRAMGSDTVALQSWSLLPDDGPPDWREQDMTRPHVCVISSVGALSSALVANDGTDVYIECLDQIAPAMAAGRGVTASNHLHMIASIAGRTLQGPAGGSLHVRADLGTLLEGVAVSSSAPGRFLELVTRLVQNNTNAAILRAQHMPQAVPAAPAQRPEWAGSAMALS